MCLLQFRNTLETNITDFHIYQTFFFCDFHHSSTVVCLILGCATVFCDVPCSLPLNGCGVLFLVKPLSFWKYLLILNSGYSQHIVCHSLKCSGKGNS